MKISIVTAVFNGGEQISRTLASVAEQDHGEIEHIIIDGGSHDSTLENIRLNGRRVALVLSERDNGVYDAFNKGMRRATGDVIAFLNCGDTYMTSQIVSQVAREFANLDVEAVFGDVLIVDAEDRLRVIRHYSSKFFSPSRMSFGLMPAHPTLFMRRSVYDSVGEYNTQFRIAGDFELCLRVFTKRGTKYCYMSAPLVRMPRGGLSNAGWRSKLEITREMRRACRLDGIPTTFFKLCLRFPLKIAEMI